MVFTVTMVSAIIICLAGILYRFGRWFVVEIGPEAESVTIPERMAAAFTETVKIVFSPRIIFLVRGLFADVLLQLHLLRQSFWRWGMHMALFYGFGLLILMHALDDPLTRALFPWYESTLNPFFFLRNLFGLMVLIGAVIAVSRRLFLKRKGLFTSFADRFTLGLITTILLSGFALEAVQIGSEPIFDEMVVEYMDEDNEEVLDPLKVYWAAEYGVVFSRSMDTRNRSALRLGAEIHQEYCAYCHSHPVSAFVSYPLSRGVRAGAVFLNRIRADRFLRTCHFLAVFIALALLPFSKFFHLVSTPISLLVKRLGSTPNAPSEGRLNRRALALDACTHCGVCSLSCSVAPLYRLIPNPTILPSEKLATLRKKRIIPLLSGKEKSILSEGSFICTECRRCTDVCPSGIDLQDLWHASKQDLIRAGFPEPHLWIMRRTTAEWADQKASETVDNAPASLKSAGPINLTGRPESFASCVQCTTCTTVCPVVAAVDDPAEELDLTPQQVMNLLRLEMKQTAMGARMIWKCVTCYLCQEHCPQGVKVADVMYELRNIASDRFQPAEPEPSATGEEVRSKSGKGSKEK